MKCLLAILVLALALCFVPMPATLAQEPVVVAIQAFLDEETTERILAIWNERDPAWNATAAYEQGAIPHITFGSWRVPPSRVQFFVRRFETLEGSVPAFPVEFELRSWRNPDSERTGFYLYPGESEEFLSYHRDLHQALNFPFQHFRQQDIPGQWRPHLTLFNLPKDKEQEAAAMLEAIAGVATGRIERFGVVVFGPIRVIGEIHCTEGQLED